MEKTGGWLQEALIEAVLQADHTELSQIAQLQDLSQRIQQHQHKQQQLHKSEADQDDEQQVEREQQEDWDGEEDPQNQGSSLYYERQQIRLVLEQVVEHMLVHMRGAASLQARAQDRMQKTAQVNGNDGAEEEKLPLLRHVTRECWFRGL